MIIENDGRSAKEVLAAFESEAPFADVLVQQFLTNVDSETIVVEASPFGPVVLGDVSDDGFIASLRISQMGKDMVSLQVFAGKATFQSTQMAEFKAEELLVGVRLAGHGDELTYGIHFSFEFAGLYLPSTRNEWLMDFAGSLAQAASEVYSYEQPRFFHSDKRHDPVRNK